LAHACLLPSSSIMVGMIGIEHFGEFELESLESVESLL
jgi:hypothetical protein